MKYEVKIKNTNKKENIEASSKLEAGLKFCEAYGLDYRLYANRLIYILINENEKTEDKGN
jgi:hypothetical protein